MFSVAVVSWQSLRLFLRSIDLHDLMGAVPLRELALHQLSQRATSNIFVKVQKYCPASTTDLLI